MARLLVVDDDPLLQRIYLATLSTAGHQVAVAGSLAEARGELARGLPDAVVLDLHLPDGTGTELVARIRDRSDGAACRIVIFSGVCDEDLTRRASAYGVDAILSKHGNGPAKVTARIDALLASDAGPPPSTVRTPSPAPVDPIDLLRTLSDDLAATPSPDPATLATYARDCTRIARALAGPEGTALLSASAVLRQLADGARAESALAAVLAALRAVEAVATDPTRQPRAITAAHILVVDDDPVALRLLAAAAAESGARVTRAESADAAIASHRAEPCQVVVTDLRMPGTSGIRLARGLKQGPAAPRIILATAAEGFEADAFTKLADDVVAKPFLVCELALRIQTQLLARG